MNNDDTMHEQVAKYVAGEASPEEAMQVEEWAGQSTENESYLKTCFQIFTSSTFTKMDGAEERVWKNIQASVSNKIIVARKRRVWMMSAAASILLLLTTGLLLNNQYRFFGSPLFYEASLTSENVQLNDGTEIILAPHATISIDKKYSGTSRSILLTGSASFSVKHDLAKPYVVTIGKLHVKDNGTRFTITSSPDLATIEIAVQEGSVIAYNDDRSLIKLNKHEVAVYITTTGNFLRSAQQPLDSVNQNSTQVIKPTSSILSKTSVDSHTVNRQVTLKPEVVKEDSVTNLSAEDAAKIFGTAVKQTGSNSNKNDGLLKQSVHYQSVSDDNCNLYGDLEYFANEAAAHKMYERLRSQNPSAQEAEDLTPFGAKAFSKTNGITIYLLVFQKRNIIFRVKISKLNSSVSTDALLQMFKHKAQTIK